MKPLLRAGGQLLEPHRQTMLTDTPSIPVGVDGEAAELNTPLELTIRPGALRLLQPSRNEPVDRQFSLRW
jgi:hypothetical protein